jgi:hypothetical protein
MLNLRGILNIVIETNHNRWSTEVQKNSNKVLSITSILLTLTIRVENS